MSGIQQRQLLVNNSAAKRHLILPGHTIRRGLHILRPTRSSEWSTRGLCNSGDPPVDPSHDNPNTSSRSNSSFQSNSTSKVRDYTESEGFFRRRRFLGRQSFPPLQLPLDPVDVEELLHDVEELTVDEYSSAPFLYPNENHGVGWAYPENWISPGLKRGGMGGRYLLQFATEGQELGRKGGVLSANYSPNYPVTIDLGSDSHSIPGGPGPQQWSYSRLLESSWEPQRRLQRFAQLGRIYSEMEEDEDDEQGLQDVDLVEDPGDATQDLATQAEDELDLDTDGFGRDVRSRAGKAQPTGDQPWKQDATWFDQEFDQEFGDMAAMRRAQGIKKSKRQADDTSSAPTGPTARSTKPVRAERESGTGMRGRSMQGVGKGMQTNGDREEEQDEWEGVDPEDELLGVDQEAILARLDGDDNDDYNAYDGRFAGGNWKGADRPAGPSPTSLASAAWDPRRTVRLRGLDPQLEGQEWQAALLCVLGPCGRITGMLVEQDQDDVGTGEGLIQFDAEVAKARALALDGITIEGCKVSIQDMAADTGTPSPAAEPLQPPPGGWMPLGDDSSTIFVKGLDVKFSEEQLRLALWEVFRTAGKIIQIRLPMDRARRPTGIAYIVYKDPAAKAQAQFLDSCEVLGRAIKVDINPTSKANKQQAVAGPNSNSQTSSRRTARPPWPPQTSRAPRQPPKPRRQRSTGPYVP